MIEKRPPELIFIHGWGFDASFWDALAALLPEYHQRRVDLGFFGASVAVPVADHPQILIGHSLGLMHGLRARQDWAGWVAINGFARFVPDCVPASVLRDMRRRLAADPAETLRRFYALIGAAGDYVPSLPPDVDRLIAGLDELRDGDISALAAGRGLVLASRHDPLVPVAASEVLAANAALHWHETGGHLLPIQDPTWCAAAIKSYLINC